MTVREHLSRMKKIYDTILAYIEDDCHSEEMLSHLIQKFEKSNIRNNLYDVKDTLYIILKISNNHHRGPNFFIKIEEILKYFKDQIKNYFSNSEIFNIFKSNKRLLLFLISEKIMMIDEYVFKIITSNKYAERNYPQYFSPEIKPFVDEKFIETHNYYDWVKGNLKDLPENFDTKRKQGENDNVLCEIIRNDSLVEFISYIKNNRSVYEIESSIFETNSFLLKNKRTTLIEYAAFFGSIQIFQYLLQSPKLKSFQWIYAIHGKNMEIIQLLENTFSKKNDNEYKTYFNESIKCHHNDLANYYLHNFLHNEDENKYDTLVKILKHHNFDFIQNEFVNESLFVDLCKYDYCSLVKILLQTLDIDINKIMV